VTDFVYDYVASGGSLARQLKLPDGKLRRQIISFCRRVAGSCQITTACIVGDYALGLTDAKTVLEILLVIRGFQPRLMSYVKILDDRNAIVFAVDDWVFERDVDRGFLGEALAERIILPYVALKNENYLHLQEVKLKKRLILELFENLVLDFPELSYNFHIKPEYFMHETMLSRARLFPPMIYTVLNFMQNDAKKENTKLVMRGYLEALRELEEEDVITFSNGYVKIPKKFVEKVESKKIRFINVFKTAQRALFNSLLGTFSETLRFISQNRGMHNFQWDVRENSKLIHQLEDPLRYLYIPTAHGLVPLSAKMDIEAFARKVLSMGEEAEIEVEKIGGVLNDVYLVSASADNDRKEVVVKRFKDWSNFKWFPLNLWALGTRTFAVLGRLRLERECAINQQLYSMGLDVPKILYVSHGERLIFMEYVEGEKLDKLVKRIAKSQTDESLKSELDVISRVGEKLAKVHALGISLGDTKPENIMVRGKNGEICLLDLEQASRSGDKVWDIAEFLYYTGHYLPPLVGTRPAELITKAFIEGYLEAGGDVKLVRKVGNPKYTKVFSIFTLPHIILAISSICRQTGKLKA
jgi:tRNA A-37 threonylcarbamoyl transferase component Bud32